MCIFRNEWLVKYTRLKQVSEDNSRAFCKIYNRLFTVSHGGENYIKKHASRTEHQGIHNWVSQNQLLCTFIITSQDSSANKVMSAELVQIKCHMFMAL
jgi:hypothetical protein